jgi:hypothetical protein
MTEKAGVDSAHVRPVCAHSAPGEMHVASFLAHPAPRGLDVTVQSLGPLARVPGPLPARRGPGSGSEWSPNVIILRRSASNMISGMRTMVAQRSTLGSGVSSMFRSD